MYSFTGAVYHTLHRYLSGGIRLMQQPQYWTGYGLPYSGSVPTF